MDVTQDLRLNINQTGDYTYLTGKQADTNSRFLRVTFWDDSRQLQIPGGAIVSLRALKPDGTSVDVSGTNNNDGTATVELTDQVLAVPGTVKADVSVAQSGAVLSSATFYIKVQPVPVGAEITSENDFLLLNDLLSQLSDYTIDPTLSVEGAAADAKATGDAIASVGGGLTEDIKQALLQIASKVAYIDDDGQDYYDALEDALYPPANLVSISAVYTQSGTVYDTDTLDSLKPDLVVTAHYDDHSTSTVASTAYVLSGTLTVGTSTITVSYGGKTTTFTVTVSVETALYPFDNGGHTFTSNNRHMSVSNGNHFEYTNPSPQTGGVGAYVNISKPTENDTSGTTFNNISNYTTVNYTIPSGANVSFKVTNINGTRLDSGKFSISLETFDGTSVTSSIIKTGDRTTFDDISIDILTTSAIPVTCVYIYIKNSYSAFEADFELRVDGVRWI